MIFHKASGHGTFPSARTCHARRPISPFGTSTCCHTRSRIGRAPRRACLCLCVHAWRLAGLRRLSEHHRPPPPLSCRFVLCPRAAVRLSWRARQPCWPTHTRSPFLAQLKRFLKNYLVCNCFRLAKEAIAGRAADGQDGVEEHHRFPFGAHLIEREHFGHARRSPSSCGPRTRPAAKPGEHVDARR
jgi:hypothetical protein